MGADAHRLSWYTTQDGAGNDVYDFPSIQSSIMIETKPLDLFFESEVMYQEIPNSELSRNVPLSKAQNDRNDCLESNSTLLKANRV